METADAAPNSLWWIAILSLLALSLARELGYLLRKYRERSTPGTNYEGENGFSMTSVMGLLALLIAFTFSLSLQRYEQRRQLVNDEANALSTTWLRIQLAEPAERARLQQTLKQYVDVRVRYGVTEDYDEEMLAYRESEQVQERLWAETLMAVKQIQPTTTAPLLMNSVNESIDIAGERFALRAAHLPAHLLRILAIYALICAAMIGFHKGQHRFVTTVLFVLLMLAGTLILDLDRPRGGSILVSQQPMIDLQQSLKARSP